MFEKVNPSHPDKVADRIAGAIVDYAYTIDENPKIAVEVLLGHGQCFIIIETSLAEKLEFDYIKSIVARISDVDTIDVSIVSQDEHLAKNQSKSIKCGDNGIFKGMPITLEQAQLTSLVKQIYRDHPYDGKYIINNNEIIMCQSNIKTRDFKKKYPDAKINPLGDWVGGLDTDSGATNRKLGSDMGDSVTGGGLHGKDLSKADVSVNIYAFLKAQKTKQPVELYCAIGDGKIDGKPYSQIVEIARKYINELGGFEKFAEWGLINGKETD